jgi:hypothetical protein
MKTTGIYINMAVASRKIHARHPDSNYVRDVGLALVQAVQNIIFCRHAPLQCHIPPTV